MDFKDKTHWEKNRSVLKKGTSPGGQIIYKGEAHLYEEDEEGKRKRRKEAHRFLIRIGKKVSEAVEGDRRDAENKLLDLLAKHRNGGMFKATRMTVRTYLVTLFLPGCYRRNLAPNTIQNYEEAIHHHILPLLGSRRLDDLSVKVIQQFLLALRNERGLDYKYAKNIYGCLRTALNRAVAEELIKEHNARHPKIRLKELIKPSKQEKTRKKRKRREQAWSHSEVIHFFAVAPNDDELTRAALVGTRTGMRPGELCARRWEDLRATSLEIWTSVFENKVEIRNNNPELQRWEIGDIKTGEGRSIHLDCETLEVLYEQKEFVQGLMKKGEISEEAGEFIFPSRGGNQAFTNPAQLYERWRFFVKGNKNKPQPLDRDPSKGGRPPRQPLPGVRFISLYGWRHTHATELLRRKEPEKLIAERLGTSVEMIRKHYGHILAETEAEAIESLPSYRPKATPDDGNGTRSS